MSEAELLSIYFEETAADQYRRNREMKKQSGNHTSGNEVTDIELGDIEEEEDE